MYASQAIRAAHTSSFLFRRSPSERAATSGCHLRKRQGRWTPHPGRLRYITRLNKCSNTDACMHPLVYQPLPHPATPQPPLNEDEAAFERTDRARGYFLSADTAERPSDRYAHDVRIVRGNLELGKRVFRVSCLSAIEPEHLSKRPTGVPTPSPRARSTHKPSSGRSPLICPSRKSLA